MGWRPSEEGVETVTETGRSFPMVGEGPNAVTPIDVVGWGQRETNQRAGQTEGGVVGFGRNIMTRGGQNGGPGDEVAAIL